MAEKDESSSKEYRLGDPAPPRRAFISSAAIGITTFVAGVTSLAGCNRGEETAQRSADDDDLESLRKVDPKLIKFREAAKIEIGLEEVRNVAVGIDGSILAVGDSTLLAFDSGGRQKSAVKFAEAPMCVAQEKDGTLYAGLTNHVEVYDSAGKLKSAWEALGETARVTAISIGDDGIFVANAGGRVVIRYDRSGKIVSRIGLKDDAHGYSGLVIPSPHLDVAPAKPGFVLVSNPGMHRIETHSVDGIFQSSWGQASSSLDDFCGCCNPTDFALLPDGRFITSEKGIPRVKIYSEAGKFEGVVAGPDTFASNAMGIDLAVDSGGRVLVLDARAKAIRIFVSTEGTAA